MKLRELFADKSVWTTGTYARDSAGGEVHVSDIRATKFCLVGAMRKCYSGARYYEIDNKISKELEVAYNLPMYYNLTTFNDTFGYDHVKNLVDNLDI